MRAVQTFEEFQESKHFALLDGIRAMAILAVLWHHSAGQSFFQWALLERGYLGVDLFFVLSGFLITHLLIKEKRIKGKISLSKFYVRRTLRIFPLYYGYLLALMAWAIVTQNQKLEMMLSSMPYYLLYVSNWMPEDQYQFFHRAWSLAVEEQFYLLWPLLVVGIGFFRPALMIIVALGVSMLCAMGFLGEYAFKLNQMLVPYRTILLGCLVAIGLNTKKIYEIFAQLTVSPLAAPLTLAASVGFIAAQSGPIVGVAQMAVQMLMAAFLMTCVINEENYLKSILSLAWVRMIGVVSYGIYILHGQLWGLSGKAMAIFPGDALSDSRGLFFVVLTLLSTLFAYISYNTYEKFFMKKKQRYEVK